MVKHIGIITWHYYNNFGSVLQAYALQKKIIDIGYKCSVINYRDKRFGKYSYLKYIIKCILDSISLIGNYRYPFVTFQRKHLVETQVVQDVDDIQLVLKDLDCVICGSDQIWAPNVLNPIYMLSFVPDNIPKISYAASIGLNDIPKETVGIYKKYLSRFQSVSLREKYGADLLQQKCGIKSEVVLDPTLLVGVEEWEKLERKIRREEKYIFCYFLNPNHKYKQAVQAYAQKMGVEVVGCSANAKDCEWMSFLDNDIGPCEFLWLIHHAEVVFTDSYHGTIFSLLFHKRFVTFERFENTDKICQNSRIYQLDDYFGLSQHIIRVSENTEISVDSFDYNIFENRLDELRKKSMEYLQKALED